MKRRNLLIGLAAVAAVQFGAVCAALAAGYSDKIVQQLREQGFSNIEVERTWLGRDRILAERKDARREIIVNPNTGEILRDLWFSRSGGSVQAGRITDDEDYDDSDSSGNGGGEDDADDDNSGSGGGGEDDEDSGGGDSDDDSDDSDDNSGSGSDDD